MGHKDMSISWKKAMAPHSSTLAWKIPWAEEPGGLQSMGSLRVGHNWATSLSRFTFMHWRRKWQPTPAFLPGESQGQGSLVGCRLWGCTESDTTEATQQQQQHSWFTLLYVEINTPLWSSYTLLKKNKTDCWLLYNTHIPQREGIYVLIYVWLIHFAIQKKLIQHCKATKLQ